MLMGSHSLASFNLPKRRFEEETEEMMGFVTMEDFKGMIFDGLSSMDRLTLAVTVLVRKTDREKRSREAAKPIKKNVAFSSSSSSGNVNSSTNPFHVHHNLVPGLIHGKYFNFDHEAILSHSHTPHPLKLNWMMQGHPKKPRSASTFRQNSTMKATIAAASSSPTAHCDQIPGHTRCLKRKYHDGIGDEDDQDWAAPKKQKKKNKRVYIKRNNGINSTTLTLCPPSDLHVDFKNLILGEMNGTALTLVIQKELFPSDVNPNLNRLTFPPHKLSSDDFLQPNEIEILTQTQSLNQKHHDQYTVNLPFKDQRLSQKHNIKRDPDQLGTLKLPFIDPRLKLKAKKGINLIMWKLSNSERRTYVLRTTWNKVVRKHKLVAGDVIQVWSFRANNNQLHLAIVVVQRAAESSTSKSGNVDDDDQSDAQGSGTASNTDGGQSGGHGSCGGQGDSSKLLL